MDTTLRDILNSLPDKPPRSRLAPYAELIDELLKRGWTYRGIAGALVEKCGVQVSASNVHHFVKKAKTKRRTAEDSPPTALSGSLGGSGQMYALCHQPTATQMSESEFTFDPTVPLRIKRSGNEKA